MASSDAPGLILQHEPSADAGHFADWLADNSIEHSVHHAWEHHPPADPGRFGWICTLGSDQTPGRDGRLPWVDVEIGFLRDALETDVPVLGLCFGGQALAAAAGASVAPADPAEVGWIEIETENPDRIPPGPWLHFHYDQFALPEGATELARSPAGTAAFELGNNLGLQFHPEVTPEIANGWATSERETLRRLGVSVEELAEAAEQAGEGARRDAYRLFDSWWTWLGR
jgi:GMP synthase-like glutamine amidotransferase